MYAQPQTILFRLEEDIDVSGVIYEKGELISSTLLDKFMQQYDEILLTVVAIQ